MDLLRGLYVRYVGTSGESLFGVLGAAAPGVKEMKTYFVVRVDEQQKNFPQRVPGKFSLASGEHGRFDNAQDEALRLAKESPGTEFLLVESVGRAIAPIKPVWTPWESGPMPANS